MEAREVDDAAAVRSVPAAEPRMPSGRVRPSLRPFVFPVVVYVMSRAVVLSAAYFAAFMKMVSTPRAETERVVHRREPTPIYRVIARARVPGDRARHGARTSTARRRCTRSLLRVANRVSPLSARRDGDRRVDGPRPRAPALGGVAGRPVVVRSRHRRPGRPAVLLPARRLRALVRESRLAPRARARRSAS